LWPLLYNAGVHASDMVMIVPFLFLGEGTVLCLSAIAFNLLPIT
jgi:hypothetical protein